MIIKRLVSYFPPASVLIHNVLNLLSELKKINAKSDMLLNLWPVNSLCLLRVVLIESGSEHALLPTSSPFLLLHSPLQPCQQKKATSPFCHHLLLLLQCNVATLTPLSLHHFSVLIHPNTHASFLHAVLSFT